MLSPGETYKLVPKDYLENLRWRLHVLKRADKSKRYRGWLKEVCSRDILFYINTFVYQFNPKADVGQEAGPFITWPCQDDCLISEARGREGILWCVENREDMVVVKSREMGASWLFLITEDWLCRSYKYQQCLTFTKNMESIDDGSPNCLFWKIDFMHKNLPDWLCGRVDRKERFFAYRDTQSWNTGEAPTKRAGAGGRAKLVFVDEFSKITDAEQVHQATASTAGCRIFNGTHTGVGTMFHKLSVSPHIKKITLHWTQHPDKAKGLYRYDEPTNRVDVIDKSYSFPADFSFRMDGAPHGGPYPNLRSPWYDKECRKLNYNSRAIAEEQDVDPQGSGGQFFDAALINSLIGYCRPPVWQGNMVYDADEKTWELVEEDGGALKLWFHLMPDGKAPEGIYACGGDISEGVGKSPTCLSFGNAETGEKVGEFCHFHIRPFNFAPLCLSLLRFFREAWFCWESQGPGATLGRDIVDAGYRRVYMRVEEDRITKNKTERFGFHIQQQSKRDLLGKYHAALQSREFMNPSEEALRECLQFKYNDQGFPVHSLEDRKDDPSATKQNHGDMAMADALQWLMAREWFGGKKLVKPPEVIRIGSLAWRRMLHDNAAREREITY